MELTDLLVVALVNQFGLHMKYTHKKHDGDASCYVIAGNAKFASALKTEYTNP